MPALRYVAGSVVLGAGSIGGMAVVSTVANAHAAFADQSVTVKHSGNGNGNHNGNGNDTSNGNGVANQAGNKKVIAGNGNTTNNGNLNGNGNGNGVILNL